mmetsp:Transcript_23216/g.26683  ORF Transcript_23216/g.26683 Transcript_23216/m.26683 type:complete len:81 (-) Transcript_23216:197-439(-)
MQQGMGQQGGGSQGDPCHDAVLNYIKTEGANSEVGADTTLCIQALVPQGYSDAQIRMSIQHLSGEGHIYSTIDDNKWQAC